LAKREKVRRRVKFRETCPFPIGVARGPFRAILFFVTKRQLREEAGGREGEPEAIASSGIAVFPSLRMGVTSTGSHRIGVYSYPPISSLAVPWQPQK
jgi:hypothetical protein